MLRLLLALSLAASLAALSGCSGGKSTAMDVDLSEWAVKPSVQELSSGKVTVTAYNRTSANMVHEVAILRLDGNDKKNIKEIEDIDPGKSKKVTLDLKPGQYELACVLVPGEAGSTVDHYQQGMHTTLTVR